MHVRATTKDTRDQEEHTILPLFLGIIQFTTRVFIFTEQLATSSSHPVRQCLQIIKQKWKKCDHIMEARTNEGH
jgi:hypothetical protein